jgi:predicted DNA-binding transcriptional regulator AlpA
MKSLPFFLVTREYAQEYLSCSAGTLTKFISDGTLPAPRSLGESRLQYWRSDDFLAAINDGLPPSSTGASSPAPSEDKPLPNRPAARESGSRSASPAAERERVRSAARLSKMASSSKRA